MKKVIKLTLPTIVFLVSLEIFVRVLDLPPYPNSNNRYLLQESEECNYELTPGYEGIDSRTSLKYEVFIDEQGFRNTHNGQVNLEKTDKTRILFIGDSMTYGVGVAAEDTFSLKFNETKEYEAFNLGVGGYSSFNSYARLMKYGEMLKPDIVVYTLFLGNDIDDNYIGYSKTVQDGYIGSLGKDYTNLTCSRALTYKEVLKREAREDFDISSLLESPTKAKEEELYNEIERIKTLSSLDIVKEVRQSSQANEIIQEVSKKPIPNDTIVDSSLYSEHVYINFLDKAMTRSSELYRFFRYKLLFVSGVRNYYTKKGIASLDVCTWPYSKIVFRKDFPRGINEEYAWDVTKEIILEMKMFTEEKLSAKFVLSAIPIKEQANLDLWDYQVAQGCINNDEYSQDIISNKLKEFADENSVDMVVLVDDLRQAVNLGKDPYFKADLHINEYGHELVFELFKKEFDKIK